LLGASRNDSFDALFAEGLFGRVQQIHGQARMGVGKLGPGCLRQGNILVLNLFSRSAHGILLRVLVAVIRL